MPSGEQRRRPSAFDAAARLLAQRPHFSAQLRRKLGQRGYEAAEIDDALARLARLGYLDDAALAGSEATRLRERKGLSRAGVAAGLGRAGAGGEAIRAALGEADAEAEFATARAAAGRWLRGHAPEPDRLARHLDRKGFPRHVIFRVLKDLIADAPVDSEAD